MKNISRSKQKLLLQKQIETVGEALPYQNLQHLLDWLTDKQTKFTTAGYTDIELKFDGGDWDNKYELTFYGVREETDKEYAARMKEVQKIKLAEAAKLKEHKAFIADEAKRLGLLT